MCFCPKTCLWEWRQLWGGFVVLLVMRGLKAASRGWRHASWIDLRKEEHPRKISRSALPAKMRGGDVLLGRVEFQIKATALRLQVSPVWCSLRLTFGWEPCAFSPRQRYKSPFGSCGLLGWGLAVGVSCLNMVDRLMSRSWKIPFMSDGHLGHFSVSVLSSFFFSYSPFSSS